MEICLKSLMRVFYITVTMGDEVRVYTIRMCPVQVDDTYADVPDTGASLPMEALVVILLSMVAIVLIYIRHKREDV